MNFKELLSGPLPVPLSSCPIPQDRRLLVLAPHPDDFDAIGVTLRLFRDNGNPIFVSVLNSSAGGVEDGFCSPSDPETKARVREEEQLQSCRFFGLPDTHLEFLRLLKDSDGHILEGPENFYRVRQCVHRIRPALVFLPHGNDTNVSHQRTCSLFVRVASEAEFPLEALLNKDPKTIRMRYDFFTAFGTSGAAWKSSLLSFHKSQMERNLHTRGMGFDERILSVNREIAQECPGEKEFAEAFEYAFWE